MLTAIFLAVATTLSAQQASTPAAELLDLFQNGKTPEILKILAEDPEVVKTDMGSGMTPLHYAAYYGNQSVFDYLVQQGADINAKDRRGLSPVWFTVSGQQPKMLQKLIALKADLNIKNTEGDNMLMRAITARDPEIVQILLDQGFDPMFRNPYGLTPVSHAAGMNSVDIIKLLVARGADLKSSGSEQISVFQRATVARGAETLHYLMDQGFDPNEKDSRGRTPLTMALDFGNMDGARALVLRGADVNAANGDGIYPIQMAVKKGASEMVNLLISKKADVNMVDPKTGKSLLHEAAIRGNSATANKLLAAGIAKNLKDRDGHTALSCALKYGNKTTAALLKKAGVPEGSCETNTGDNIYLNKTLAGDEAYVWYLRHSGWAVKTKSAILVFDYWDNDTPPDEKLLANGHFQPGELKDFPVYVFVSHEHPDHFDPQILDWNKEIPGITYIFGCDHQPVDGSFTLTPRTQQKIGPLTVTTIQSSDAGVGFAVQVDGITVFHAGDHSNNTLEMKDNPFFPEIDFLAEKGIHPDISFFLNMYGCGSSNPEAFQKGIFYAVDKLKIKSVLPMHGADKEWVYNNLAEGVAKNNIKVAVGAAVNQGDRFFFSKGTLAAQ
jgi:ankyrin repeat protein/L-ascorbate metabolism protein UlaG (beta-lactamase superfamily)